MDAEVTLVVSQQNLLCMAHVGRVYMHGIVSLLLVAPPLRPGTTRKHLWQSESMMPCLLQRWSSIDDTVLLAFRAWRAFFMYYRGAASVIQDWLHNDSLDVVAANPFEDHVTRRYVVVDSPAV